MKKIFKLFLCTLMLFSFTNLTILLADEEVENDTVSIRDVIDNYIATNYMQSIIMDSEKEDEDQRLDITISLDENNHTITVDDKRVTLVYIYTDEYIKLVGSKPMTSQDYNPELYGNQIVYSQNMLYAILDTMGYSDKAVNIDDDLDLDYEFFEEYGLLFRTDDFDIEEDPVNDTPSVSGSYLVEIRLSLSRTKIGSLIDRYGVKRPDFIAIENGEVVKPEVTIKKKDTYINLTWEKVYNATKYEIYRSEKKEGTYKKISTVTTTSYKDKKVTYGKTYYYKVKAIGKKNKKTSDIVSLKLVPAQVKNVTLSSIKNNSIKINYDKQPETGYVIYRSTDNKNWTTAKTITKNSTLSYTDTGLKANKTYYYKVRAYKSVSGKKVYGKYSEVVSAKTAPANPTLSVKTNTYDSLKLTTTEVKGATKYLLYRSTKKDGTYEKVGEVTPKYTDDNLKYGKTYYYKVKACNADNKCSGYSKVVSAKVDLVKPKLSLDTSKTIPMTIYFSNIKETEGTMLYRSTDKKNWTKIATLTDESFYEDLSAKKNKTYYYRAKTYVTIDGKKVYSAYSDVKGLKCLYVKPDAEIVNSESALDFNGVFKKGDIYLKIYSLGEDEAFVSFRDSNLITYCTMSFVGYLVCNDEEYIKIQKTDKGVLVSEANSLLNGSYTKVRDYTTDECFDDEFSEEVFIETKYNGKFTNEQNEELNLFQRYDDGVLVEAIVTGKPRVKGTFDIESTKATYSNEWNENYELEVNGSTATLRQYADSVLQYEKTFTRVSDLSKDELIKIFKKD